MVASVIKEVEMLVWIWLWITIVIWIMLLGIIARLNKIEKTLDKIMATD